MKKHRNSLLVWLVLWALLLGGCRTQPEPDGAGNADTTINRGGTVMVYAREQYRYGLQQTFSHLSLSEFDLSIFWTGDPESADILITDHIPKDRYSEFRVIDTTALALQGISGLELRTAQGVIGLPLCLRMDGMWYDEKLYTTRELNPPQSLKSWEESTLQADYPAVYAGEDTEALFWGVIAPYYLQSGGQLQELATGELAAEPMQRALQRTVALVEDGLLIVDPQAQQRFINQQACIWLAGVDQLAANYHSMSNLSAWRLSGSLIFQPQERACCVVRADMLAVKASADPELSDRFLKLFYNAQTISDLSGYVRMPAACQMYYAPTNMPELFQCCYTLLSSPAVDVYYTATCWPETQQTQLSQTLQDLIENQVTVTEAVAAICQ